MSKVLLGDVARERRETCKGSKDGYPIVGLEHLTPEEITLSAWDEEKENTFTKLFRKGDVLFGRRRAYLKKAAVAPFDGICSGDITVIEAIPEKILPELLPFIIQNDALFDFAVGKSAGSLSPRVKWEHLRNYSFELPNLEEQRRLAKVLWAMDATKKAYQKLIQKTDELVKSQFIALFGDPVENPFCWPTRPLLELGECKNGMNFHAGDSGTEFHCLGVGDFKNLSSIQNTAELPTISLSTVPSNDYFLQDEDIVFVRSNGNKELVGRCLLVYPGNIPTIFSGFCIRYRRMDQSVNALYLLHILKNASVRKLLVGRGANIQNLSQNTLSTIIIPIPPVELQETFVSFIHQSDKSKFELEQALAELTATYKRIIAENLG